MCCLFDVFICICLNEENQLRVTTGVQSQWDEERSASGNASMNMKDQIYSNCSFHDALLSLTNNTVINITTNVELLQIINVVGLTNISITGHSNPIVNCKNHGGLHIVSCNNCTIEGITWDACGAKNINDSENCSPVIQLNNSTNVTIINCYFQHLVGQAIILSGMSGKVSISHCNFSHNNKYQGHGAAVHYSSNITSSYLLNFKIDDCTFSFNENAESIVYLGHSSNKPYETLHLHNSSFYHNKAVSIYLTNQAFHVTGRIKFHNNIAEYGSGIFISDYSDVLVHNNAIIQFGHNTDNVGGAVYLDNHSSILFEGNSIANFNSNTAFIIGGAMFINDQSTLTLKGNSAVTFSYNEAYYCGAVLIDMRSKVIVDGNPVITFYQNRAHNGKGGAICLQKNSVITFEENPTVSFINNEAIYSGAIFIDGRSALTLKGNSTVMFNYNKANRCGAMSIDMQSKVIVEGNPVITFNQNRAYKYKFGGAICLQNNSVTTFEENPTVSFIKNEAVYGGAIFIDGQSTLTFTGNSSVVFSNNTAIVSGAICMNNQSNITFEGRSTANFSHNEGIRQGGAVRADNSCAINFKGNSTVIFDNNTKTGAMHISYYSRVIFEKNTVVIFTNNRATEDGAVTLRRYSVVTFKGKSRVTFNGSNTIGLMNVFDNSSITFEGNSDVRFSNGNGAMKINRSLVIFSESSTTLFNYNVKIVTSNTDSKIINGGAVYIDDHSYVAFQGNSTVRFNDNEALNGGAVCVHGYSNVMFKGSSKVAFVDNKAQYCGGAIYAFYYSLIAFEGSSNAVFHNNTAVISGNGYGGAVSIFRSVVNFKESSKVTFDGNAAAVNAGSHGCGGAMSVCIGSRVTFKGNSTINFVNNRVYHGNGGALCVSQVMVDQIFVQDPSNRTMGDLYMYTMIYSVVLFDEESTVTFKNNGAYNGGALYIQLHGNVSLKGNSISEFNANLAKVGGAIHTSKYCNIVFEENSTARFNGNTATYAGSIYLGDHSTVTFMANSEVLFNNNNVDRIGGGAMYIDYRSNLTFKDNSNVNFSGNKVDGNYGGAVYIFNFSIVAFMGESIVLFHDNNAFNGGSIYAAYNSTVIFEDLSEVMFSNNQADKGGAIYVTRKSTITFNGNSTVNYYGNEASNGGALYVYKLSYITFQGNTTVIFSNNTVTQSAGALYCYNECEVLVKQNSEITFTHNKALQGGAIFSVSDSYIKFEGNSRINFTENTALGYGGAIYFYINPVSTFGEHASITFDGNKAKSGGAIYSYNASITVTEKSNNSLLFNNNSAEKGGAFLTELSNVTFSGNSCISFTNNTALRDGGSIYLNDHSNFFINSTLIFYHNTAFDYGGAIFIQMKEVSVNTNTNKIYFDDNYAGSTNRPVYINVPKSCNKSCLFESIKNTKLPVATSPSKLILHNPAKCIHGNGTECDTYHINNVMLGQEITLNACTLDYYDQPIVGVTEFLVRGYHHSYNMSGSQFISVSCNKTTQGISVIGNLNFNTSYNYSVVISLRVARISETEIISVNLSVELTHCHPGFWYFNKSKRCECYNTKSIISCSGNNSTIKSGYWFGNVNGIPTVTSCPHDYCNFTCCEISNGIYHLSPVRTNQCTQYRTGIACGNCEQGYTLSFDSSTCIPIDACTIGQKILITSLSLLYWIAVIVAVFVMMHFKIAIGCLYAIIYYYSVMDILLSHGYFISNGIHTAINIMSSLVKLTPQFLGRLCLVRNMSGIDQQFIHYLHPAVVSFILFVIAMLARRSRRISSFISRGIIHFICFLLLLSYTSIATTSLLLLRPLTFTDIDTVYTYLSPDIKYFHGRHLAYGIVAIIFTALIVIGLPLLLLLEPFLNAKINFIKVKPLLDQFQGCYKDRYRYFAAYYMICRIVIIVLIIARIFDPFTTQYLIISVCALMEFFHLMVRPYASVFYNIFDGAILQLIVIISVLPVVELVDSYNETVVIVMAFTLIILPLISFVIMNLFIKKTEIQYVVKKIKRAISKKCLGNYIYTALPTDDSDEPRTEARNTVDHNARRTTIVTM